VSPCSVWLGIAYILGSSYRVNIRAGSIYAFCAGPFALSGSEWVLGKRRFESVTTRPDFPGDQGEYCRLFTAAPRLLQYPREGS
jgi:hypothetical protein